MNGMRAFCAALIGLFATSVAPAAPTLPELSPEKMRAEGFESIFDGRSWAGWLHPEELDDRWEISGGAICVRANQPNEWNRFTITLRGDVVDVTLNGQRVVSGARVKSIPATGPIVLQNHNEAAEFRNIYIRELP